MQVVVPVSYTHLDELERMRHALAALDTLKEGFVASVSHELRTPLAKIREALSLLEDQTAGPLAPKQSSLVAIARRACESQITLVTNLLDLSRLRAASVVQMHTVGSVADVVRDAIRAETEDASSRGVRIELRVEGSPLVRTMDAALIERAVANLLRNAAQWSPEGGVVSVVVERDDRSDDAMTAGHKEAVPRVCVRVEDQGPGVPDEARARLFEPFVTSAGAHSTRVGVGLGLALTREVARAHGGDAALLRTPDGERGARFELWLPLDRES